MGSPTPTVVGAAVIETWKLPITPLKVSGTFSLGSGSTRTDHASLAMFAGRS